MPLFCVNMTKTSSNLITMFADYSISLTLSLASQSRESLHFITAFILGRLQNQSISY